MWMCFRPEPLQPSHHCRSATEREAVGSFEGQRLWRVRKMRSSTSSKRLLRRLDKALPPSPPTQKGNASRQRTGTESSTRRCGLSLFARGFGRGRRQRSSMGTIALLFGDVIAPQRFEAASGTWKEEIRRTAEHAIWPPMPMMAGRHPTRCRKRRIILPLNPPRQLLRWEATVAPATADRDHGFPPAIEEPAPQPVEPSTC